MMYEERVFVDGKVRLGATVTCPDRDKKNPAVVIIMGTGSLDRDGNARGMHTDLYRNMAAMFDGFGYATIRYDKRGTHESGKGDGGTGLYDLVDDASSIVQYMRSLPFVDENSVIVCGHSEGAIIATLLSERESVSGLILIGGAAMSIKDALYYQNRLVIEQARDMRGLKGFMLRRMNEEKAIAKVDKVFARCKNTDKDRIFISGALVNAKWIREHDERSSEDYAGILRSYNGPILAITGTKDLSADYRFLDSIRGIPGIECYVPEGVNHILREVDDDNSILDVKKQYVRLCKEPIHSGTSDTIHNWLESNFGRR